MGMCNHCYHAYGRSQRATACPHTDKPSYALQRCMQCYQRFKLLRRKNKKIQSKKINLLELVLEDSLFLESELFKLMKERDTNLKYKNYKIDERSLLHVENKNILKTTLV